MPLLSICIPTYNRAEILDKSLESITKQDIFQKTDEVEIIVSDNCSQDNTHNIVHKYIEKFGNKIKYFRNQENIGDKNFPLAISRGNGDFLKLCNDTLLFVPNALQDMLDVIKKNLKEKPVLFFENSKQNKIILCQSIDEFVSKASYMITWIGGLGLWKEDKDYLIYMEKFSYTYLAQTALILKMTSDKGSAMLIAKQFCQLAKPSLSGNYNLAEVFIKNYLALYDDYVKSGLISRKTYNREKWRVLKKHVLPRQFNVKQHFEYDKSNFWNNTILYHHHIKFYLFIALAGMKKVINFLRWSFKIHKI